MRNRKVTITLPEEDCQWLEEMYGKEWIKRMEQHIQNEINIRRTDQQPLLMRKKWDY